MVIHTKLINKEEKKAFWQADITIPLADEVIIIDVPKTNSRIITSIVENVIKSLVDYTYLDNEIEVKAE